MRPWIAGWVLVQIPCMNRLVQRIEKAQSTCADYASCAQILEGKINKQNLLELSNEMNGPNIRYSAFHWSRWKKTDCSVRLIKGYLNALSLAKGIYPGVWSDQGNWLVLQLRQCRRRSWQNQCHILIKLKMKRDERLPKHRVYSHKASTH